MCVCVCEYWRQKSFITAPAQKHGAQSLQSSLMSNLDHIVVIFFGVSGCGKSTTVNTLKDYILHQRSEYNVETVEGDQFHPSENVEKMRNGIALNDKDREPWLRSMNSYLVMSLQRHQDIPYVLLVSCSALKKIYRKMLTKNLSNYANRIVFVLLNGSFELFEKRLTERKGHYMPVKLLQTQFDTLEVPDSSEIIESNYEVYTVKLDENTSPEDINKKVVQYLFGDQNK
jgi:gluconokinase